MITNNNLDYSFDIPKEENVELFLGSTVLIRDCIFPFRSPTCFKDIPVVLATKDKWLAIASLARCSMEDCEYGFMEDICGCASTPFFEIKSRAALDKLIRSGGYLYQLETDGFRGDIRLPLFRHNFVHFSPVRILSYQPIFSAFYSLQKENLPVVYNFSD